MSVPLSESIVTAVARLIDDSMIEPKREPTHYDLEVQAERTGLRVADPKAQGQNVGKAKRVRAMLLWALENDVEAGGRFITGLIANVRGYGGFRPTSPNYVGEEAIRNANEAVRSEGYELTIDGQLQPVLLDGLAGAEMTAALMAYVRRAQKGVMDAALVTGTGKDLLEATAKHVLLEREGACPETTFPALLGLAFVTLGMVTSQHPKIVGREPVMLSTALYSMWHARSIEYATRMGPVMVNPGLRQ
ncbi:MAG TPA: hypothetical protein VNG71_06940 [Pyrinomonadaceae bacterium]|nr:hypothetical protein [Pyrinomonadaceae bacterium]